MSKFPMPNDRLGDRTVVASVWYTEDPEIATVLLLNPKAPFFTVAFYDLKNGGIDPIITTENIVPAVREYEQSGGDY